MMTTDVGRSRPIRLPLAGLDGILGFPASAARGMVLFAHGSGSSRLSPRNNFVAAELRKAGLATLLFDLVSENEAADRANVFDIALLAARLVEATEWARRFDETSGLPIGYFGASTGAAAALVAAARLEGGISAVVSRGGRPDLAGGALSHVAAPTLLIVGGADIDVLALNRSALRHLQCEAKLEVVPGATHLFDEPGALEQVVTLARRWFAEHLTTPKAQARTDVVR
jgi:pimeloyl-ACP methyl ester carboxylesterase